MRSETWALRYWLIMKLGTAQWSYIRLVGKLEAGNWKLEAVQNVISTIITKSRKLQSTDLQNLPLQRPRVLESQHDYFSEPRDDQKISRLSHRGISCSGLQVSQRSDGCWQVRKHKLKYWFIVAYNNFDTGHVDLRSTSLYSILFHRKFHILTFPTEWLDMPIASYNFGSYVAIGLNWLFR